MPTTTEAPAAHPPRALNLPRTFWLHPPMRRWAVQAVVITVAVAVIDFVLIVVGVRLHDNPHRYFAEWRPGTYTTFILFVLAALACTAVRRRLFPHSAATFWLLYGALLFALGLDDLLRAHEHIDFAVHRFLGWDPNHPVTDHLDDLMVAGYALPAALLWYVHRDHLLRLPRLILSTAAAFACFLAMVACDIVHTGEAIEESFKLFGVTFILIGILGARADLDRARSG